MAQRDVAGLARRQRHRHANQFRAYRIETVRLGVDRDIALRLGFLDPRGETIGLDHGFVGVEIEGNSLRGKRLEAFTRNIVRRRRGCRLPACAFRCKRIGQRGSAS